MNNKAITFKGKISLKDKVLWSTAINTAVNSLPLYEREVVPEFKVYPTLIMSLKDNYDLNNLETDDIAEFLFDVNSWAYSKIISAEDDLFISLSIKRWSTLNEKISPEFSIFHEIGHFQIQYIKKLSTYTSNLNKIEFMADKYGIFALLRMLYHNPEYRTISSNETHIKFIQSVRKLIDLYIGQQEFPQRVLEDILKDIADKIMELMKWEGLYAEGSCNEEVASMKR